MCPFVILALGRMTKCWLVLSDRFEITSFHEGQIWIRRSESELIRIRTSWSCCLFMVLVTWNECIAAHEIYGGWKLLQFSGVEQSSFSLDSYLLVPKPSALILQWYTSSNTVPSSSLENGPELVSIRENSRIDFNSQDWNWFFRIVRDTLFCLWWSCIGLLPELCKIVWKEFMNEIISVTFPELGAYRQQSRRTAVSHHVILHLRWFF